MLMSFHKRFLYNTIARFHLPIWSSSSSPPEGLHHYCSVPLLLLFLQGLYHMLMNFHERFFNTIARFELLTLHQLGCLLRLSL